jgi:hypothetical protein
VNLQDCIDNAEENAVSTLLTSASRSGKTRLLALMLAGLTFAGIPSICMDWQGDLARLVAYNAFLLGYSCKLIYARMDDPKKILAGIHFSLGSWSNEYEYQKNLSRLIGNLFEVIKSASGRDTTDFTILANIQRYIPLGLKILLCRAVEVEFGELKYIFMIGNARCLELINTCTDREAVSVWRYLWDLWVRRSFTLLDREFGSCVRLIGNLVSPTLRQHYGKNLDLDQVSKDGTIVVLNAEGRPKSEWLPWFRSANVMVGEYKERRFLLTGRADPFVLCLEEVGAGLIGPYELLQVRTQQKYGVKQWLSTQDLSILPPEQRDVFIVSCLRKIWGYPGAWDLALFGGHDLAASTLDPNLIERVRQKEQQVHSVEWVKRKGKSTTHGEHGKSKTESETEVPVQKNETKLIDEIDFRHIKDEPWMRASALMKQSTGEFSETYKTFEGRIVRSFRVELPDDPYEGEEFKLEAIEEVIRKSQELPCFTEPTMEPAPAPTTIQPKPRPRSNGKRPGMS